MTGRSQPPGATGSATPLPVAKTPPPYATVVFDCDSTLATIEGIEDLAIGREDEVKALTDRAMDGELPLEDVYGARLDAIRPSHAAVASLGGRYAAHLLPNVRELIAALHALEKRVCIVSGGLLPPVRELGQKLGIDPSNVFAVDIYFDEHGAYAGFEESSPAARAGGKLDVLEQIARHGAPVALVGDGATDLEAAPACSRFVAFGGVIRRETVFAAADSTCEHADFAALAAHLLSAAEMDRLATSPAHAPLVQAAKAFASPR